MTSIVFDAHTHLFHLKVVENVTKKTKMVQRLGLQTAGVERRMSGSSLENDFKKKPDHWGACFADSTCP